MIIRTSLFASLAASSLIASANAVTIGWNTFAAHPFASLTLDTRTSGADDQARQNTDATFFMNLPAGTYQATTFDYRSGAAGNVFPFLAELTAPNVFNVLASGAVETTPANADFLGSVPFGGSDTFTLTSATDIYVGIQNPTGIGAENPVLTDTGGPGAVWHSNNQTNNGSPPFNDASTVGSTLSNHGWTGLGRSYAFSVEVEQIPEPSSSLFAMVGVAGVLLFGMRRRR